MFKHSKHITGRFVAVGLIVISLFAYSFSDNYFEISKNLDIFATLFKEINTKYVDETDPGKLVKAAIEGMLEELDPYTNFISESELEDLKFMTTGQYGGIGSMIQQKGDYVIISEPYEGFPAQKAGLVAGDKILEIDGKTVKGKTTSDISSMLKGQPGVTVKLLIDRNGETFTKEIVREEIKISDIPYSGIVNENVGYIKLNSFTDDAAANVKKAFEDLKAKNQLKGVILDLRGNGGGLLREAVDIVNIFVNKGQEVVSTRGRMKEGSTTHTTRLMPVDTEIPLIVLVDRGSASASEIVSGSIQDLDRGVVVGQRTFGKGLVQNIFPLSFNTKVKVTIAKYYTPSGRCIQAIDYSHHNEDGSAGKVPDSLIKAFKTKIGRTVYDGGGINPDVLVTPEKISEIAVSLITKQLIFDYATKYRREHASIPAPKAFKVTDAIYKDFMDYIDDKEYDYKTESEKAIEDFKKTAEEEKYFSKVADEYEKLKTRLTHNKKEDLISFKSQIVRLLQTEIVSRYYYQKGTIENALEDDVEIKKCVELLTNDVMYKSILNGTFKQEKEEKK